uniref:Uncharacterized protein n=1 Tax=Romanomermis culicivorax TaxID=13658 RepID=A0A915KUE1_ROMCU
MPTQQQQLLKQYKLKMEELEEKNEKHMKQLENNIKHTSYHALVQSPKSSKPKNIINDRKNSSEYVKLHTLGRLTWDGAPNTVRDIQTYEEA